MFEPPDSEIADELIADAGFYQPYTVADVIGHLKEFPETAHVYMTVDSEQGETIRVMEIMEFHDLEADEHGPLLSSWIP